jgi:methionine biosynthesis protein MetW
MRLDYRVIADWITPEASVLDLGCGDGELLSILVKEKGVRANGIEIDEQAIYKCVEKGLSVFHEDIEEGLSGYPDESFDYVIMNGSLQQVKKPDTVFKEALSVGKKLIVGFPNFLHYSSRFQMLLGRVPVTPSLPYQWYDTPNLHFLSILDFQDYCKLRGLRIEASAFLRKDRRVGLLPNLFAEQGLFLLSK